MHIKIWIKQLDALEVGYPDMYFFIICIYDEIAVRWCEHVYFSHHRPSGDEIIDNCAIIHKDRAAQDFAIYIDTNFWRVFFVKLDSWRWKSFNITLQRNPLDSSVLASLWSNQMCPWKNFMEARSWVLTDDIICVFTLII